MPRETLGLSAHGWTLGVLVAVACSGCGQEERVAVRTVTVHEQAARAAAPASRRAHRHETKTVAPGQHTSSFRNCDQNISVKAATTTCGFAQNAFYEYWTSGEASSIEVYSPAAKRFFATHCTVSAGSALHHERPRGGAVLRRRGWPIRPGPSRRLRVLPQPRQRSALG